MSGGMIYVAVLAALSFLGLFGSQGIRGLLTGILIVVAIGSLLGHLH